MHRGIKSAEYRRHYQILNLWHSAISIYFPSISDYCNRDKSCNATEFIARPEMRNFVIERKTGEVEISTKLQVIEVSPNESFSGRCSIDLSVVFECCAT